MNFYNSVLAIIFFNFFFKKYKFILISSLIIMHFKDWIEINLYLLGMKLNFFYRDRIKKIHISQEKH